MRIFTSMRDYAKFKEKINDTYEYQKLMRISVIKDLETKMQELSAPYNTLSRIKNEAERVKSRWF
jgi:hypothetical protein